MVVHSLYNLELHYRRHGIAPHLELHPELLTAQDGTGRRRYTPLMETQDVSKEMVERFRQQLIEWSHGELRSFPWRERDRTPYEVMIAEILLQRTRAENVVPVYREFINRFGDASSLAEADQEEIAELLQPLGLQNRRSKSLKELASRLKGKEIPRTESELRELPHVGLYGANATLCFGFDQEAPIVDGNVIRVYQRIFGIDEDRQRNASLWDFAEKVLPPGDSRRFNLALLDFAASICTPGTPRCEECFANEYCEYFSENRAGENP